LLHGDKVAIGTHEIRVVDSARVGSTQLFDSGAFADLAPPRVTKKAAGKTGGRVVCLTDGREYTIGEGPLRLGRDAASDVVVSGHEVSRLHAEIQRDPDGYLLVDVSVNGTYVNGQRIGKTHRLSRADVIRVGNDEFRFYADARVSGPQSAIPLAAESDPQASGPPGGAVQRLSDTMHGLPATEAQRRNTPASSMALPLASLLFRTGDLKGRRLPIKVPVVNIGRGDYNDVVISDPSVSTMHAKLQRREAIWILTDLGSTNGTFVEGERLTGEVPLSPGTTLRFGDVSALFEPLDETVAPELPNRTKMMPRIEVEPPPRVEPPRAAEPEPPKAVEEEQLAAAAAPADQEGPVLEAQKQRARPRRPIHMAPPRPKSPSTLTVVGLLILVAILAYLLSIY
jgi:pSer/pThr/pTyr-binding forkhead associated (FHA) protein